MAEYGFDGVYYGGVTSDLMDGYELMRETRELLGDKLIYLHSTYETLFSHDVYRSFIDTYADFVLRGEYPADFRDEKYIRYVLSGHNTSNAIGFICHCCYPAGFVERIVGKALEAKGRFCLVLPETETEAML